MLVLFETAAGFALFKVLDEAKLTDVENIYKEFETPAKANKVVSLKKFSTFANTADALASATCLAESSLSQDLKKFLQKYVAKDNITESLAVADKALGSIIREKLNIKCVNDSTILELMRGIRSQLSNLITGMQESEVNTMALGLSHSLSRYKLKFSPDKVDTMIVQAIALLDDLDKELNIYAMRVKEWYGWHFPELAKVVADNILYAKTVKALGMRTNVAKADFSGFLAEDVITELKEAALISMGTEVSEEDAEHILELADQVIAIALYREQLFDYLKNRMQAIAPNLTVLVGELVGARLISHAGSLMSLAKYPASTVQILGAEKALFRSLKTKHNTPKYGLIYHASLVGQSGAKNKGKISRVLAAKVSLGVRIDALGEESHSGFGLEARAKVENRLRQLEGQSSVKLSARKQKTTNTFDATRNPDAPQQLRTNTTYVTAQDVKGVEKLATKPKKSLDGKEETKKQKKRARDDGEDEGNNNSKTPSKKDKKKRVHAEVEEADNGVEEEAEEDTPKKEKKKHKKKKPSNDGSS